MFQSLNLEVEKAKAIEKARQEKAIREHTSKIAETVSQPISSYGLFQKLQKYLLSLECGAILMFKGDLIKNPCFQNYLNTFG